MKLIQYTKQHKIPTTAKNPKAHRHTTIPSSWEESDVLGSDQRVSFQDTELGHNSVSVCIATKCLKQHTFM